ncbi:M6 family metalloprotease domain-containing protein [bacterium]|nr:M6 family metalloprotease domain-containing protein [bacterium]
MMLRKLVLAGAAALAGTWLCASAAYALTPPSEEQWAAFDALGQRDEVNQHMLRLDAQSRGAPLSDAEVVSGIERDYGLPATKRFAGDASGSARLNFDMNHVIDERDILPLGFLDTARQAAMTLPFGAPGDNFQPNILVLMIKFPDQEPTDMTNGGSESDVNHNTAWAEDHWNDLTTPGNLEDTSVAYYYKSASYDKLQMAGDVFFNANVCDADGWITSSYNHEQIDGDGTGDTDKWWDVIDDAITQIDPYIDFSDYDSNDDGYVDGLVTIYAGPSDVNTDMWHFRWFGFVNHTTDGVRIYNGIWTGEEAYIRTWCHEFGHELGLPDLYDVGGGSSGPAMPGIGYWGVMGDWTSSMGKLPPLPCAFSRMHLRFAVPVDVLTTSAAQSITVNRTTADGPVNTIFRVWRNAAISDEFFLLEFRDADHGFDQRLPGGGGILIWHVDEGRTSAKNRDNAFDPQRVWLECAGDVGDPTKSTNPWRQGHNGADAVDYFDDSTTPNAKDNGDVATSVVIDPTSGNTGTTMTADVTNSPENLVNYDDDIRPEIFEFICLDCHDSAKSGGARMGAPVGVDFDTYARATQGDIPNRSNTRIQAETMPPGWYAPPLSQEKKDLFQAWIDDGIQESGNGLPALSWDEPPDGATVSGNTTVDVTSDAADRVEYYVDGSLKHIERGPGPYSGFTWDTLTALDGSTTLRAVAYNSSGTDPVRVIERTVTVSNGAGSGKALLWSEDFDSYSDDQDNTLLGAWSLHEDAMGLDIKIQSNPAAGSTGMSIAFAQSSFPDPPANPNNDDPNAGVYQGQDDEWIMSPRIYLQGYSSLELKYKVAMRGTGWSDAVLATQITDDDGATWDTLESVTYFNPSGSYNAGSWETDIWAQRAVSIQGYANSDVYIRFLFAGGRQYNTAMGIDDVEITGTPLDLDSVTPARAKVGDGVTLAGSGFGASQGAGDEVRFYDGSGGFVAQATVTSWSDTQIICDVPSGATSNAPGGVWVYAGSAESNKLAFAVILPPPNVEALDQL